MEDKKMIVQTKLGELKVKIDNDSEFPGVTIMLNNCPIVLLEEVETKGENKIVLKRYPNKNVYTDDEHFNYEKFQIDPRVKDKDFVNEILEDIRGEENE